MPLSAVTDSTVDAGAPARRTAPPAPVAGQTLPLSVQGLGFHAAGRVLLEDVSFEVQRGMFTVILGPNGAGKSLLLRLCHGLLRPAAGKVAWHGLPPARARSHHAMVFQRPVLLRRSVAANVDYPLAIRGVPRGERRERVRQALDATGLARLRRMPARRLSGGEQQRLAIARAWALQPEALLLDEPTANLDPRSTLAVETLIERMCQLGTTVIMTTHDLAQARRLARQVLFLNRGRLVEDAAATDFFTRPHSPEATAFLNGELLA